MSDQVARVIDPVEAGRTALAEAERIANRRTRGGPTGGRWGNFLAWREARGLRLETVPPLLVGGGLHPESIAPPNSAADLVVGLQSSADEHPHRRRLQGNVQPTGSRALCPGNTRMIVCTLVGPTICSMH